MVLAMACGLNGLTMLPAAAQAGRRPVTKQHPQLDSRQPPGTLGFLRQLAGDSNECYFQAIRIVGPPGMRVSPAEETTRDARLAPALFGMQVGKVYRLRLLASGIYDDVELYPSIELIGRTYPPSGMETRFAVPIEFSAEDIRLAIAGHFIVRVIYVEDPDLAAAFSQLQPDRPTVVDVQRDQDPLHFAGSHGRPIAVVRLGGKVPGPEGPDEAFLFGSPEIRLFDEQPTGQNRLTGESSSKMLSRNQSPIVDNPRLRRIAR